MAKKRRRRTKSPKCNAGQWRVTGKGVKPSCHDTKRAARKVAKSKRCRTSVYKVKRRKRRSRK